MAVARAIHLVCDYLSGRNSFVMPAQKGLVSLRSPHRQSYPNMLRFVSMYSHCDERISVLATVTDNEPTHWHQGVALAHRCTTAVGSSGSGYWRFLHAIIPQTGLLSKGTARLRLSNWSWLQSSCSPRDRLPTLSYVLTFLIRTVVIVCNSVLERESLLQCMSDLSL
jgi:hypothetical protein